MFTHTPLIAAPADRSAIPEWRRELAAFRKEARAQLRYDASLYARPDFNWTTSNFACCMAMLFDSQVYSPAAGRWTIESFLEDGVQRLGGYDSVVLWHAYPRIGTDNRNQFDFYREMPGGLAGLANLTRALHARGVRVFVDYNPWDTSTRREAVSDEAVMSELVGAIGADGVFLDTLASGGEGWRAALDAARPGVALESELALPLEGVATHHLSWAQGFADSGASGIPGIPGIPGFPGVLRNKWFERRHMMHVINRWSPARHADIQAAWMNGVGVIVWENVFGTAADYGPHDAWLLRVMLPIQRRYAALFAGEGWTPHVATGDADVFASLWESDAARLWTLVNRAATERRGALLEVEHRSGYRWFDLVAGVELTPNGTGTRREVSLPIQGRGIGAVLEVPAARVDKAMLAFIEAQANMPGPIAATMPPVTSSPPVVVREAATVPEGMAVIPAAEWTMVVAYRERECGFYRDPTLQMLTPSVLDQVGERARTGLPEFGSAANGQLNQAVVACRRVSTRRFAIGLTPVTNAEFARFLSTSGYVPRDPARFLDHWRGGRPPGGMEDHPVVYVDLNDARAFADWAGKRLPTEEEWQFAAQGGDQRLYPWGNDWLAGRCNAAGPTTTPVRAFPLGRSPFGCFDMIGNTWEWTQSERSDHRTRFCIIKGGSFYHAAGSDWYADGGPRYCNFAAKFVLMWPGLDRCATIGFRCAADLPGLTPAPRPRMIP